MSTHQPPAEDPIASSGRAAAAVGELRAGVAAEQWPASTPGTEWDVRHLVDHLIAGNRQFAALVQGQPLSKPSGQPHSASRSRWVSEHQSAHNPPP